MNKSFQTSKSFQDQVNELKNLLKQEREIGVRILEILSELDRDKKYLAEGYSSLFSFCVEALGMSESAAYTRIVCLREMKNSPSLEQEIQAGAIKPTQVVVLLKSIKQAAKPVTPAFKQELIESLKNLTKEQTKAVLVEKLDLPKTHKLTLELSPELKARLDFLKQTCSHQFQTGSGEEILGFLLSIAEKHLPQMKRGKEEVASLQNPKTVANLNPDSLERSHPQEKQPATIHDARPVFTSPAQVTPRQAQEQQNTQKIIARTANPSRYIPTHIRDLVLARSRHQCEFQNPHTHKRCSNRHYLQFDHITPYSKHGPSNDPENIQLLCSAHNQWKGAKKVN